MSANKIAKRYASALMDVCGSDQAEAVLSQLQAIESVVLEKTVHNFLVNPESTNEQKLEVILELGKQVNVSELVSKFFRVLNDASRLELLAHMSKPFEELLLEKNNTVKATVTSVVSLSESDLDSVRVKIEAMVGKKVLVEQVVDTSILGGLVVRVGNNILDLSLRNKLDTMTKTAIS